MVFNKQTNLCDFSESNSNDSSETNLHLRSSKRQNDSSQEGAKKRKSSLTQEYVYNSSSSDESIRKINLRKRKANIAEMKLEMENFKKRAYSRSRDSSEYSVESKSSSEEIKSNSFNGSESSSEYSSESEQSADREIRRIKAGNKYKVGREIGTGRGKEFKESKEFKACKEIRQGLGKETRKGLGKEIRKGRGKEVRKGRGKEVRKGLGKEIRKKRGKGKKLLWNNEFTLGSSTELEHEESLSQSDESFSQGNEILNQSEEILSQSEEAASSAIISNLNEEYNNQSNLISGSENSTLNDTNQENIPEEIEEITESSFDHSNQETLSDYSYLTSSSDSEDTESETIVNDSLDNEGILQSPPFQRVGFGGMVFEEGILENLQSACKNIKGKISELSPRVETQLDSGLESLAGCKVIPSSRASRDHEDAGEHPMIDSTSSSTDEVDDDSQESMGNYSPENTSGFTKSGALSCPVTGEIFFRLGDGGRFYPHSLSGEEENEVSKGSLLLKSHILKRKYDIILAKLEKLSEVVIYEEYDVELLISKDKMKNVLKLIEAGKKLINKIQ